MNQRSCSDGRAAPLPFNNVSESLLSATNLSAVSGASGLTAWTNSYNFSDSPTGEIEISGYSGTLAFAIFMFPFGNVRVVYMASMATSGSIQFSSSILPIANTGKDNEVVWPLNDSVPYGSNLYSRIRANGRLYYQCSYENGSNFVYLDDASFSVVVFTV